jgi:DNA-binding transcriptional regulator YdaS (Cro superfamily)
MARGLAISLALIFALLRAPAAQAIDCGTWSRLMPLQRRASLNQMIRDAVAGSEERSYRIDRGTLGRCLRSSARSIATDVGAACSEARSSRAQEPNRIFKTYIWSCVG